MSMHSCAVLLLFLVRFDLSDRFQILRSYTVLLQPPVLMHSCSYIEEFVKQVRVRLAIPRACRQGLLFQHLWMQLIVIIIIISEVMQNFMPQQCTTTTRPGSYEQKAHEQIYPLNNRAPASRACSETRRGALGAQSIIRGVSSSTKLYVFRICSNQQ